MKTQLIALFGMFALFLASCAAPVEAPKAIDMEKLKVDIQAMEDAFSAGEAAKDADAVVAYYSDDAMSYSRNEEPAVGKAAIKEKIAKGIAKDTLGNKNVYKVVDLWADGNTAVEIGSWTVIDTAGAEVDKGYYMSLFQLSEGKYLCIRDMSVSSMPKKD